jgi:hypothetical protein
MGYKSFSLIFGFSIWLIATLAFRFWGHIFFAIENAFILIAFFLGAVPILFFLAIFVFNRYRLNGSKILESSVLMTIPGMLIDVACMKFYYFVFPNLSIEQVLVLGPWILWVYGIVLVIGILKSKPKEGLG